MGDLRGVDINLIVVLDAILTERSLTRAGEAIGLTQPAVSGAVAKLRKLLDDPLLVRNGRTYDLTPRALALEPVVRAAMSEVGRTFNLRPLFDPATSDRQFRISASDYALSVMTGPLLRMLEEQAPGVSIEFSSMNNIEPVDLLREDVAIVSAAHGVPGKRQSCGVCRSLAVFCDRFVSLVADDENARGGFNDVVGNGVELVDLQHAIDLGEEPFEQAEVAAGDAFDGGDGLSVGEVVRVESPAESLPVAVENEEELFPAKGAVVV